MRNVVIVNSTNINDIIDQMPKNGANFTNGTYAFPIEKIQETMLAGFEFVNSQNDLPMVVAINSDMSMRTLEKNGFASQQERARKIATPLTDKFQDRQLIIIFYDEPTPTNLYRALSQQGLTKTLHKWGYGITPQEPKIEGAEYFDAVYAFPMPVGHKPICYHETDLQSEPQKIQVVDLRSKLASVADQATVAHQAQSSTSQNTFIENAKRFAVNHKYTLFAAGAALAVAACVVVPKLIAKSSYQN